MTTREFEELTGGVRELNYKEWWDMHDHYATNKFSKDIYCEAWAKMYSSLQVAPGLKGFDKPGMEDLFECHIYRVLANRAKKRYVAAVKRSAVVSDNELVEAAS